MGRSPIDWVPPGAWLTPGYAEWAPPAALRDAVACLWARVSPDDDRQPDQAAQPGLVLPDACSDLIWERGVGGYVAGPDTGPARPMITPGAVIVGVRFRPSAGGQALKTPLSEIANQRVPLSDLLPPAARRLSPALDPAEAADRALDITGALIAEAAPDRAMARAAVLLRDPAARAEAVAAEIGLSERQFRRRSQAAAGYGPKTLQRVLRFHRFVRLLDAAPALTDAALTDAALTDALSLTEAPATTRAPATSARADARPPALAALAALAAQAGYADQAHLTRECSALSGFTPVALARIRRTRQG